MDYEFDDKELESLYASGKSRKLKLPPGVAERFVERVARIEAAVTVNDLRNPPSMHFEAMEGYRSRFSIRINNQYRLEFEIDFEDAEQTKGVVTLKAITNHYH